MFEVSPCDQLRVERFSSPMTNWFFIGAGNLNSLNELAKQARADHILHTGDFGFYDDSSLERIAEK